MKLMYELSLQHGNLFVLSSPQSPLLWGSGASESRASSKNELQGSLDVTICGLQRPQHQLLILDPHVPELLHLGLPAALAKQKRLL